MEIQIFKNSEFGEVRTILKDNEPWFVGKDVANYFGDSNYRRSLARLDEDEKGVSQIATPGGAQQMTIVNEAGLYSLLFYMQPQKAKGVSQMTPPIDERIAKLKKFKRWVTSEVLPAIRKHGVYAVDKLMDDPDTLIEALMRYKEEREARKKLEVENQIKDQQIAELKPKATYYDLILQCKDLLSVTEIAKDYGMSAKTLNKALYDLKIQYKQSGIWFLYAKYQDKGYTHTKTQNYNRPDGTQGSRVHTYWTQKGRLFIYDTLKDTGILPLIEQESEYRAII